jgi:hypothetical protein
MKHVSVELNRDPRLSRVFIDGQLQKNVRAIKVEQDVGSGAPVVTLEVTPAVVQLLAPEAEVVRS